MPLHTRNLLAGLMGGIGGGQRTGQGQQGLVNGPPAGLTAFPKTLRADDYATASVSVSATDFTRLGTRTVGAQTVEAYGQGGQERPENQGYIRVSPTTGPVVAIAGLVRLFVTNANETNTFVVLENRTDRLDASTTDKNLLTPLPLTFPAGSEDSLLGISMNADTAATWSPTSSTFVVPITVFQ